MNIPRMSYPQYRKVGVIHLVEEMYRRFLVLVGPVDQDIKIIPGLGGNGDKLLIPEKIIHQRKRSDFTGP